MRLSWRSAAAVVLVLAVVSASALLAQRPPSFTSRVNTVEVHVTVRGSDGQFVGGLTKDDFELYDNGKRREITVFSSDVQPISAVLLLDRSGSVSGQAEKISAAAEAFVNDLLPADRAAVHSLTYECQPLTNDKSALLDVLRSPPQGDMGSPIWAGLDRTMSSLAGVSGRRAILLFSDGQDSGPVGVPPGFPIAGMAGPCTRWTDPSEAAFTDASKRAQREGIMVYTVSVEGGSGSTNDDDLRAIARGSGGERYRLKQEAELADAFTRIVDELHHQYLLGFTPEVLDGKVHSLSVRVKRPGVTVRGRESYVAIDFDRPLNQPVVAAEPPGPLTDADVTRAIRDGSAGQRAQAGCMAFGVFPTRPEESEAFAEIVLEGPMGRIMRLAREAKMRREVFDPASVTDALRAPVVQVTAEVKRPLRLTDAPVDPTATPPPTVVPTPSPTPAPALSSLVTLRLRSKLLTEVMLKPLGAQPSMGLVAPPLQHGPRRVDLFDLGAFRSLPGADVEIVVRSTSGVRYCSINARDRAAVK